MLKNPINNKRSTINGVKNQQRYNFPHKKDQNRFRRTIYLRRYFTSKYQNFVIGYHFACNNFGIKEIYYRINDDFSNKIRESYKTLMTGYVSKNYRSPYECGV